MQRVSLLRSFLLFFWFFSVFLFSRLLERLFLLAEEIIVAALTEVSVVTAVGIIYMDEVVASLATHEELRETVIADVHVAVLVSFILRDRFAAVFTNYCFHRSLLMAFLS